MTTKGEYRVGISFNPSNDSTVDKIKRAAADLIDLIESINAGDGEKARLKALAATEIESAAMWAVKAATKPEMKGSFATPSRDLSPGDELFDQIVRDALSNVPEGAPTATGHVMTELAKKGFLSVSDKDVDEAIARARRG